MIILWQAFGNVLLVTFCKILLVHHYFPSKLRFVSNQSCKKIFFPASKIIIYMSFRFALKLTQAWTSQAAFLFVGVEKVCKEVFNVEIKTTKTNIKTLSVRKLKKFSGCWVEQSKVQAYGDNWVKRKGGPPGPLSTPKWKIYRIVAMLQSSYLAFPPNIWLQMEFLG